jgi:mycofactocin precursor
MQQPSEQSVKMTDEPGEVIEEESLIEEISIDGMCGVY